MLNRSVTSSDIVRPRPCNEVMQEARVSCAPQDIRFASVPGLIRYVPSRGETTLIVSKDAFRGLTLSSDVISGVVQEFRLLAPKIREARPIELENLGEATRGEIREGMAVVFRELPTWKRTDPNRPTDAEVVYRKLECLALKRYVPIP